MTNAIIIRRNGAANYVIESDCGGTFTTENQDTALDHIRQLFGQQNIRIRSFREEPEKWTVKSVAELPS